MLRRLSNPFALWSLREIPRSNDLHPKIKDEIFLWQLGSTDFTCIDASTLLRADISRNETYSEKILKACHRSGIVSPSTGHPITAKIDRSLVKTMPMISVEKQRELVMLLFFWEEEITRWRILSEEEEEIHGRLAGEDIREGYKIELMEALRIVRAKKRVLPSLRDQSGRIVNGGEEQLPSYEEARRERRA